MQTFINPGRLAYWKSLVEADPSLRSKAFPRLTKYIPHTPTPKQAAFLLLPHKEGFFGGAARGGKSDALLAAALQYVDIPYYSALIVRRTYGQLNLPDSILNRAHAWLGRSDARWNAMHNRYEFPSGSTLQFGYLQHFKDVYQYDGASFHFIGFDELTQFLEAQYRFLFGRLSRQAGEKIPLRMRSASNPGGPGHGWVKDRLVKGFGPDRFFIPANLIDNPYIDQAAYRESLKELDPITRKQREEGDWDVNREGTIFKREWFQKPLPRVPSGGIYWVRFWDLAATLPKPGRDPDYVVGSLVGRDRAGRFILADVRRDRLSPKGVEDLVYNTARSDGRSVKIRIEQEPGASGKMQIASFVRLLAGWPVNGVVSNGPKVTRWMPLAAQIEKQNFDYVEAPWNHEWFEEICSVPEADHDDQADSAAGAFNVLTLEPPPSFGVSFVGGTPRQRQEPTEEPTR